MLAALISLDHVAGFPCGLMGVSLKTHSLRVLEIAAALGVPIPPPLQALEVMRSKGFTDGREEQMAVK